MLKVGVRIRPQLDQRWRQFHAAGTDGHIGTISAIVTDELLAAENVTAVDPRDIMTLRSFDAHVYSIELDHPASPELCAAHESDVRHTSTGPSLTREERVVLTISATGRTSDEVAEQLGPSSASIGQALASAIEKLGARSKLEAVVIALRAGLLDPARP